MGTVTPTPLSAAWLYDELMQHIEPDLVSTRVHQLDEVYAGETAEQRKERMESYVVAMQIFIECLQEVVEESRIDCVIWNDVIKMIDDGISPPTDV